jgi:hypothetical protein
MKVTEEEIRPEKVFNEYLKLTRKDVVDFFGNVEVFEINCPACDSNGIDWIQKEGFNYQLCLKCKTIFVSPRPLNDAFNAYYTDSPSTKYWATTFYKITEAARREKLWKPKAQLIKDRIRDYESSNPIKLVVDIGGGYGVFDEEIKKIMDIDAIIIEPSIHLANICKDKGLHVIEKFMEDINPNDLPKGRKCFVSFELFEHLHDPSKFLQTVFNGMGTNDLFIFTTLSGMGVDIQVLKQNAKALSPPHHLNFLNPKSVTLLLQKIGFNVIEAITPGKLDMDILKNHKDDITQEFWKNVVEYYSEAELDKIQTLIAESGLSSHMMITCFKP